MKTFGDLFFIESCHSCLLILDVYKRKSQGFYEVTKSNLPLVIYNGKTFDKESLSSEQGAVLANCTNPLISLSFTHKFFIKDLKDLLVSETSFVPTNSAHTIKIKEIIPVFTASVTYLSKELPSSRPKRKRRSSKKKKNKSKKVDNRIFFRHTKSGYNAIKQFNATNNTPSSPNKKIRCLNANLGGGKLGVDGQWNHGNNK